MMAYNEIVHSPRIAFKTDLKTFAASHRQLAERLTESYGDGTSGNSCLGANDMEVSPLSCIRSQVKTLNISE